MMRPSTGNLLIFLGILIFSINNGFSQDIKQYREKKAQLHIDSIYSGAIAMCNAPLKGIKKQLNFRLTACVLIISFSF